MPQVQVNDISMHYEQKGSGRPLLLIPYLAADNACYAFQVAEYAKHYPACPEDRAGHVMGLSLGGAVGMWLAAKYPAQVKSLSLHSTWPKTDLFLTTLVTGWQVMAKALGSVPEMVIQGIFPWCFTPELYNTRPDYIEALSAFVRGRPVQPLDAFMSESAAVPAHDATGQLGKIHAPTLITFGRHDQVTSTRFAQPLREGIAGAEALIFEECAHAPIYERVDAFNEKTLAFLRRQMG